MYQNIGFPFSLRFCTFVLYISTLTIVVVINFNAMKFNLNTNRSNRASNVVLMVKKFEDKTSKSFHKCRPMFQIGANKDLQDLETSSYVERLQMSQEGKVQLVHNYKPFVEQLPKMVVYENGHFEFRNDTRLKQRNGELPYLSCKVRMYEKNDILNCVEGRQKKNETFWIAFIGDSKMRNKFAYFVKFTDSLLRWQIKLNEEERQLTFREYFRDYKSHSKKCAEATIPSGPKLSYLHASLGLKKNNLSKAFDAVYKWADDKRNDGPDAIFIDFGLWHLYQCTTFYINCIDDMYEEWKYAMHFLKKIAEKIPVILVGQSRGRSMENNFLRKRIKSTGTGKIAVNYFAEVLDNESLKPHLADVIDTIMLTVSEGSDTIFWDSTLPFNLASARECRDLVKEKYSAVFDEFRIRKPLLRLMCHDSVHKTESTVEDEIMMILNMMCNNYIVVKEQRYCCM